MDSQNYGFASPQTFPPGSDAGNLQDHIAIQATSVIVAKYIEKSTTMLTDVQLAALIVKVKAALR
jgi:hypothetical protein